MIGGFSDSALLQALLDALESAGLGCSMTVAHPGGIEIAYANEAYARMLGVDLETARKQPPLDAIPKDEAARIDAIVKQVRRGEIEPLRSIETRFVRPDGTELPIEAGFGHVLIGERRATFCFFRDLSAQASMEAALRESEDRFRTVAEASPDSIVMYAGTRCVYANPTAKMYELQGVDLSKHDEYIDRLRRGERLPPLTTRRTSKTGETHDFEASLAVTTIGGKQAVLVFTRDITERQRLQAELLKQDRLASLGVLAAGVAHELNNPLAALSLMVGRLRSLSKANVPSGELANELEQVDDAVRRMSAIIGDLLFLARPGDRPHAHVDVAKVLASSVALLRAGVPECANIDVDIAPLPPVHGFPSKLGQAVVNVLRNALQACADREDGKVRLSAHARDREVVIVVEDNGDGIPEDVMPRLMTPFFTTKEGGTGLGLWITQGIMQSHGGRLEVTSARGAGTKVTLVLPA